MEKKKYIAPRIEWIPLDSEISLALESNVPPSGPGEVQNNTPNFLNVDPFKSGVA